MQQFLSLAIAATLSLTACNQAVKTPAEPSKLSQNYPIALQKIAEDVWVHTSNYTVPGRKPIPSNGLIVADGEELIMVDTAWGEMATKSLMEKIKIDIGKPVTCLLYTSPSPRDRG